MALFNSIDFLLNKKAILEQLRISLDLAHKKSEISDEASIALNTLYQDKQKLNEYADELFESVSPLNMSIYQVNGELASLNNYEDIIFSIPNVRETTREKFNRYYSVLDAYKNSIGRMTEDYDRTYVTFWYQRHTDNKIVIEKIHAYEFISRIIIHTPDKNQKYIRCLIAIFDRKKFYAIFAVASW